jgi:hypothetical protein
VGAFNAASRVMGVHDQRMTVPGVTLDGGAHFTHEGKSFEPRAARRRRLRCR